MDRKDVSFWGAVRRLPGTDIFGWVTVTSVVLGVGGGTFLLANTRVPQRVAITGDFLVIVAPLLGVVFAAFALVIALFSDEYLELLSEGQDGVVTFLRPFMVAIGLQVGALVATIVYRAGAESIAPVGDWGSKVEVGAFLVTSTLVFTALLDVLALAKNVMLHGMTRAEDARVRKMEAAAEARRLDDHRRATNG